jgi:hypothetical protein
VWKSCGRKVWVYRTTYIPCCVLFSLSVFTWTHVYIHVSETQGAESQVNWHKRHFRRVTDKVPTSGSHWRCVDWDGQINQLSLTSALWGFVHTVACVSRTTGLTASKLLPSRAVRSMSLPLPPSPFTIDYSVYHLPGWKATERISINIQISFTRILCGYRRLYSTRTVH